MPIAPPDWVVDASASGDLTGDGIADAVLVLRRTDRSAVIRNDELGAAELDTNPRRLAVFERQVGGGFRSVAVGERILPSADSAETPCLADPLAEGGIEITDGVLILKLQYWQSCGSWGVTNTTFRFRREHAGRFRLIGFDRSDFSRSSGGGEESSFNFLTARKASRSFSIEQDKPPPWRWSRFTPQAYYLDTIDTARCLPVDNTTSLC